MSLKNVLACIATLVILFLGTAVLSAETGKLNINTATEAELAALPEIGPDLAAAIVEYRELNGDFTTTSQLLEIEGIDEAKKEELLKVIGIYGIDGTECSC
ncbi:MAG: helix-hairpin-helix domain-containing protein [Pseudomonadota bacterium]|nr:helix-hairpin-helix domain-containing protein [Pseudomonadota bacterium]